MDWRIGAAAAGVFWGLACRSLSHRAAQNAVLALAGY
jgi:hypothetical protein